MNQGPTSDSSPEGPLADYRQAGLQRVLSECKLNTGGLGLGLPGAVAAELGPALTAGHFPASLALAQALRPREAPQVSQTRAT